MRFFALATFLVSLILCAMHVPAALGSSKTGRTLVEETCSRESLLTCDHGRKKCAPRSQQSGYEAGAMAQVEYEWCPPRLGLPVERNISAYPFLGATPGCCGSATTAITTNDLGGGGIRKLALAPAGGTGGFFMAPGELKATRGVGAAAPKVLSAIPARITNAANHIFGSNLAKHKLGGVLGAFEGDATAATYALENATQVLANQGAISGFFKGTVVEVAGFAVTVQGRVINGVAHLSTAFIP